MAEYDGRCQCSCLSCGSPVLGWAWPASPVLVVCVCVYVCVCLWSAAAAASRQCWADRSESPTALELPRSPGRSANLHQRLSSPSRKR